MNINIVLQIKASDTAIVYSLPSAAAAAAAGLCEMISPVLEDKFENVCNMTLDS